VDYYTNENLGPGKNHNSLIIIATNINIELEWPAHIPNISTVNGLLTIIAVGNIVELAMALDHSSYTGSLLQARDEAEAAITQYHLFIRWFSQQYCLLIGQDCITPRYLFAKRLADFAATIYKYRSIQYKEANSQIILGFTPSKLHQLLSIHISECWPYLMSYFNKAIKNPSSCLYWTGPVFSIRRRTNTFLQTLFNLGIQEQFDYSLDSIYSTSTPPYPQPTKRDRPSPSSPLSPYTRRSSKRAKVG
jgi:hypothetical protein